ncbi:MAG: sugar phosphate isomerase/epimerase [Sediminibacterium sp.]|nr:sugar phosphate isomerase/epimerase [Sediminibacterium sp.]
MKINYCGTFWGSEDDLPNVFVKKILDAHYDGIEINLPAAADPFTKTFIRELENVQSKINNFTFIAQQLTAPDNDTVADFIRRMEKSLLELVSYQPTFINAHTGKDYFSFDDNCKVLEAALNLSRKTGVHILHETHRGRFSFQAASLIPYLKKFPELELVGDFSHFCTVSESMLQDQKEVIEQIIPHVSHIHARVGYEQSPQVNDPFAPEWQQHFKQFEKWWQQIIDYKKEIGYTYLTITPEFGPAPYMPALPYTKQPLANQWEINFKMMQYLKANIQT